MADIFYTTPTGAMISENDFLLLSHEHKLQCKLYVPASGKGGEPKTGIELIAEERQEQIHKHGWSLERDAKFYAKGELIQAAKFCEIATGRGIGFTGESPESKWPDGWDNYYRRKILKKTKVQALTVAGAFYMAENDRLGENKYQTHIEHIAAEIDDLLTYNQIKQKYE